MHKSNLILVVAVVMIITGCGNYQKDNVPPGDGTITTPTPTPIPGIPSVIKVTPANRATDVSLKTAVTLTFSEAISAGTGTCVISSTTGTITTQVMTSVNVSGNTVVLTPASDLAYSTTYSVTVSGVTSSCGVMMTGTFSSRFTTIQNPNTLTFDVSDETKVYFFAQNFGARANIDRSTGIVTVLIAGTDGWMVNLALRSITVNYVAGVKYRVAFDCTSASPQKFSVEMKLDGGVTGNDYTLFASQSDLVCNGAQSFDLAPTQSGVVQVAINMGVYAGTYDFSPQFIVTRIDP